MVTRKAVKQPEAPTLKEAREARGWSQADLALESLCSPQVIERLEDGVGPAPNRSTLGRICEALGVEALAK